MVDLSRKVEICLPTPHEHQGVFIRSPKIRKMIRAGRRWGKTVGAGIIAVEGFKDQKRVLYAAPTADQVERFWYEVCTSLREPIDLKILNKNETKHIIEIPNSKTRIKAKTAWNAETLRGDYADILILDEYQLMNEDAWKVVGAPMLMDNGGTAIFVYTPPSIRSAGVSKAQDPRHAAKMFKERENDPNWLCMSYSSLDNPFLSEKAIQMAADDMTALAYRQEILAEDVDEVPGALWTRALIDEHRIKPDDIPTLKLIVVGVDPQAKKKKSSETGIVVAGYHENGHGFMLEDNSVNGRPEEWGRCSVEAYHRWEADRVIGEVNNGGDMVKFVINTQDEDVPFKDVHASRNKTVRAEPISQKAEKGLIHHAGYFPALEDEMCSYTKDSLWSPNRLDAYVWAFSSFMLTKKRNYAAMVSSNIRGEEDGN